MPSLDGVRAIAVLAVIAFHAGAVQGGWLGVEVFFVLSGYLITTLVMTEIGRTGTVGLRAFWGRRVRRLWPAICVYLLVLIVIIVPRTISVTPPTARHLVATLTWRENWQMIGDGGYGASTRAGAVEHFWSLSIEEQFYLVWPLLLWAVARWRGPRWVRPVAGLIALVSATCVVWGVANGWTTDRMYLGSDTRVLGLAVGAMLAGVRLSGRIAAWAAGLGTAVIVAAVWWFGDVSDVVLRGPLQGVTAVSALTVVAAAGLRSGPLAWRPVRAIGRWSFGIYLWHVPIGMIVRAHVLNDWIEALWTAGIATAVAAASYRLIERPVRERRPLGRAVAWALTGIAVVCMAVAAGDVQQEYRPAIAAPADDAAPGSGPGSGGDATDALPATAPHLVLVGDSVPFQMSEVLDAAGTAAGYDTTVYAADGCLPTPDPADQIWGPCNDWIANMPTVVADADIVVWWFANAASIFGWHGTQLDTCSSTDALIERFDAMMAHVSPPDDATLMIALPSPRADLGLADQNGAECQRAGTQHWAAEHGYVVYDPDPARLAAGSEREVRRDGLHYTSHGAEVIASDMVAAVAAAYPVAR